MENAIDVDAMKALLVDYETPGKELRETMAQIAESMRHAGQVESAHFMDVAALALRDGQSH